MDLTRAAGGAVLSLTGIGLLGATVPSVLAATSLVGVVLAGFGALVGVVLVAAGVFAYRSDLATNHVLRVAGWNTLGVIVLGAVLGLMSLHPPVELPVFVAATVVGVSAVAHVLIGVNDVRRIRAEALAREREKLSVLNRLVRHDLRTDAQRLLGFADRLGDGDDPATVADELVELADRLGGINEKIERVERAVEAAPAAAGAIDLRSAASDAAATARGSHPRAEITVDVPAELSAIANEQLAVAIEELLENAVQHNDAGVPRIEISATRRNGTIELRVADNGPGIPDSERAIVAGDRGITQLEHASGLGLWMVKWIVEAGGGTIDFADDGRAVVLALPAA